MPDIQKQPGINSVWAQSGQKSAPDVSKIDQGYVVEKPPFQVQNWIENKQDAFNAHVNQHGIPYKDDETEYQAGKSYVVDQISGIVYRCVATHVNQPVSNPLYWDIAFSPYEAMVPIGSTQMFAGQIAPRGWLVADGRAVSRTQYAPLFAVIGTTFGSGNGSSTFNLPDMRGVVVRGVDNGRGLDPSRAFGSYQADLFASHTHSNTASSSSAGAHTHTVTGSSTSQGEHGHILSGLKRASGEGIVISGNENIFGTNNIPQSYSSTSAISAGGHSHSVAGTAALAGAHAHTITVNNASSGGSETRMKNIAMLGIIKF